MTEESDQKSYWNDAAGPAWVRHAAQMDAVMAPALAGMLNRAQIGQGARVLDIGCGTGISVMQAARLAGETGHVTGCDVSDTLLAMARKRAAAWKLEDRVDFLSADAQSHAFEEGAYTHLISRFGVMFFDDPEAAFANMVKALAPGGRISSRSGARLSRTRFSQHPRGMCARFLATPHPVPTPMAPAPLPFAIRPGCKRCWKAPD